jgi:hypothetical protein
VFSEPELVHPLDRQLLSHGPSAGRTNETSHDTSDSWCNLEEMGDGLWVEELVLPCQRLSPNSKNGRWTYGNFTLSDDYRCVLASDCDGSDSRSCDCLEGIFCQLAILH